MKEKKIFFILMFFHFLFINIFICIYEEFRIKLKMNLIPKVYFMYLPYFNPLFSYQKKLVQNCETIKEADYLVMYINSYFRYEGYTKLNWNNSFYKLVFSKKIIAASEEDVLINIFSFNFKFINQIDAVIGINSENDLKTFYKKPKAFSHIIYASYQKNHNSSFESFINRQFYIQTAISNKNDKVNSNRNQYLLECMLFFGNYTIANYGELFHNQDYYNNEPFKELPPSAYFGFAMENSIAEYRITEKLFFTYRNDVIPIYRGSVKNRDILKYYGINTKAFIDASNMTVKELILYLNELIMEKNKTRMYEIYRQPLIPNKTYFDEKIVNSYKKVIYSIE